MPPPPRPGSAVVDTRQIQTEEEYRWVAERIWELFDAEPGTPEGEELVALWDLAEAYEAIHYPMKDPTPVAAIEFRMDQANLTLDDLAPCLGGRERAAAVLALARGERGGGSYPVSFAVPATFELAEVSAAMWISRDVNPTAPCAKLTLDAADLIAQECAKGFYHATADLTAFNAQSAHVLKLEQSGRDAGAAGGLLMLVYAAP